MASCVQRCCGCFRRLVVRIGALTTHHLPSPPTPPVFAGSLFSASFEDPCTAVVGASGGVFGLVGLFLADVLLNFETTKRCGCFPARIHIQSPSMPAQMQPNPTLPVPAGPACVLYLHGGRGWKWRVTSLSCWCVWAGVQWS